MSCETRKGAHPWPPVPLGYWWSGRGCLSTSVNFYVLMTTTTEAFPGPETAKETTTALLGTPKRPGSAQRGPFGGPGQPRGPDLGPTATDWSNWVVCIHTMCVGPLAQKAPFSGPGGPRAAPGGLIWAKLPLAGPTETSTARLGHPIGPVLVPKAPFGGPGCLRAALGGLLWSLLPPFGPTGMAASIPCNWAP